MESFLLFIKKIWHYSTVPLFELSGNKISIINLVMAILVFYLSTIVAKMAQGFVRKFLNDKGVDTGIKGSVERFTRYIVLSIGVIITFDTVGVSFSSLAAVGAILMVGIGFGVQNIAQNFISGLIILLERPIKVGDVVSVKGITGKVIEIGARSTLIHTKDDIAIIVPNSQFISEQVVNESFSGNKMRIHLKVGVSYGSDCELVKNTLLDVAKNDSDVLSYPAPEVFFNDFADSALQFELLVWVNDLWSKERILSNLRFKIDAAFRTKSIKIPFPQRDVHLYSQS